MTIRRNAVKRKLTAYQVKAEGMAGSMLIDSATLEKPFQDQLANLARNQGWMVSHIRRSDATIAYDAEGVPDLTLVHALGGTVMPECKTLKGVYRPAQLRWANHMKGHRTELTHQDGGFMYVPSHQLWMPTEDSIRLAMATIMRLLPGDISIKEIS